MPKRRITAEDIKKLEEYAKKIQKEKEIERQEQSEYITKLVAQKKAIKTELDESIKPLINALSEAKDIEIEKHSSWQVGDYHTKNPPHPGQENSCINIKIKGKDKSYSIGIITYPPKIKQLPFISLGSDDNKTILWQVIYGTYESKSEVAKRIYIIDLIQKKMEQLKKISDKNKNILLTLRKELFPYTQRNDGSFIEIPTPDLTR